MSTHPNVILLCTLTPDDLGRKTFREISAAYRKEEQSDYDDDIYVGTEKYHTKFLEDDYDEDWQIGGSEGDILIFDLVTYGYGEQVEWEKLNTQKKELETWAKEVCEKHRCNYKISITANYW